jgi:hypothetical protein
MALTRPILYSVPAFDATNQYTFSFNVIGGDQVVKNQLTIIDQSNNQIVYQQQQITFAFTHTLNANTLVNGKYYSASLITYNSSNESSSPSVSIQFYCYTNPSFNFNNMPVTNVITNSNYVFEVSYNQNEGELLNNYTFNLYDAQRNLLSTSGMMYTSGVSNLPLIVFYQFSGLQDNTFYFVQATGQTLQGTQISTGFIGFSVSYVEPSVFSVINLTNNCQGGYIIIRSNLSDIPGTSNPSPPLYIDENTAVDVTENGSYIIWDKGFSLYSDFTASLWGREFTENSNIITLSSNSGGELTINYRKDENGLFYAELFVKENNVIYYLYTNSIVVNESDSLQIWLRRISGIYEIGLYNLS